MNIVWFVAGLVALVVGADLLVRGASRLALSFGISPLVVGLTIVAFGTSAPEMAVSANAALDGKGDLAIGNVVGSNIFNVLFILGISALITPLVVHMQLIRQEVPIMLGASLLLLVLSLDGSLSMTDGACSSAWCWPTRASSSCNRAANPPPTAPKPGPKAKPRRPVAGTANCRCRWP
jgi:cation:H+ antiporter